MIGTLGVGVSGVIRLGFDPNGNLYAANGGSPASIWQLNPATGAIISTVPQSGAVTTAGSGDVCLQPGTGTLFTVAGTSLFTTDPVTGVNTLLGTMLVGGTTALPGNATGCAFDSTGRLVISQVGSSQLYAVNIGTRVATALASTAGQIFLDLATGPARTADLRVSKTATNITPADAVTFTVTVTNDGPDRATDVRLVDVLPAGLLTFVSASASQGAYSTAAVAPNPAGTWRVGTLNNGATATLTINATVAAGTATATNTAQVYYVDQRDPDSVPNNNIAAEDDQASVIINRSPDLQVVKSAASSFAVGVNGTYTRAIASNSHQATQLLTIIVAS